MNHLIIGGGIAGTTCAEELRKLDASAEITIVSEEPHRLYSRVLLPHYLKGKIPRERVFLKPADWYERNRIEWLPGLRAEKFDVGNRFVLLSDGRELPFDKLLIATGGDVKTLREDCRGVSYFRTLDDADHLLQLMADRSSNEAVVFGGGFIACEFLNFFAHAGLSTTLALRGNSLWSRTLGSESQALVNAHLTSQGVVLMKETAFDGIAGSPDLASVSLRCPEGRRNLPCSILGIGIGIAPDISWVREAGIDIGTGVRTNEFLETNAPGVFAAGDAVEFFDVTVGRHRVVGNWMNAMTHGRVAARNMLRQREAFRLVSSYATNVLGLEVIFVGDADREQADEVRVFGSAADGGVTEVFLKQGKASGATILGRNRDRAPLTKAIESAEPFVGLS